MLSLEEECIMYGLEAAQCVFEEGTLRKQFIQAVCLSKWPHYERAEKHFKNLERNHEQQHSSVFWQISVQITHFELSMCWSEDQWDKNTVLKTYWIYEWTATELYMIPIKDRKHYSELSYNFLKSIKYIQ